MTLYQKLHMLANGLERFRISKQFTFDESFTIARKAIIPKNGIYIFFEEGETVPSVKCHENRNRIVRVGTHTGDDRLWPRIREHFKGTKDTSSFRKEIGRCLLERDGGSKKLKEAWEINFSTSCSKAFSKN